MNEYPHRKTVRVSALFKSGTTPYDPTTVSLRLQTSRAETTHVYGQDARVTKTGTGAYLCKVKAPPGKVVYTWFGEGPGDDDDAIPGAFMVLESPFKSG